MALFVLVNESHRGQYGSEYAKMKAMLPNASYIGFTGTPLLKTKKSTARKFGGFIHKYTIDQAVSDEAVLPLLYEGRSAKLSINKQQIDKGFDRLAVPLNEEAQALERHLAPKDVRDTFYQRLSSFARVLQVALSSEEFNMEYNDNEIQQFKNELKFFQKMRVSGQNRYAEVASY